jgi:flagellar hook-basal body complex protein FliE
MQIQGISNIASGAGAQNSVSSASGTSDKSFSDIFNDALNNAVDTEAQDQMSTLELLAGEDQGPHTAIIESQKAELALNLAIQIRNKVIDAYNEVMRMQL